VETGATGTAIGTRQANTTAIVNTKGIGSYAASLCNDLTVGGYNDWFLPSKDELDKLHTNKVAIGGFTDDNYWSSSGGRCFRHSVPEFSQWFSVLRPQGQDTTGLCCSGFLAIYQFNYLRRVQGVQAFCQRIFYGCIL